jgi:hypothetical protein
MLRRLVRLVVAVRWPDRPPEIVPLEPAWPVPREHLELLFERLKDEWETQLKELQWLDDKNSVLVGATVVLLGLVVAALPNVIKVDSAYRWGIVAVLLFGSSVFTGLLSLWPRNIKTAQRPAALWSRYYAKSSEETLAVMSSTLVLAMTSNGHIRIQKSSLMEAQLFLLQGACHSRARIGTLLAVASALPVQRTDCLTSSLPAWMLIGGPSPRLPCSEHDWGASKGTSWRPFWRPFWRPI